MAEQETVDDIDGILKDLAAKLAEPEPVTEPVTEPVQPVEPKTEEPGDDTVLKDAAFGVFSRLTPEEKQEWLKKQGLEVAPKKQIQADEVKVATAAQQLTSEKFLKKYDGLFDPSELPADFDEMEPDVQDRVKFLLASEKIAEAKKQEAMKPWNEAQAQAQHQALIKNTATEWSREYGRPDLAAKVEERLSRYTPEHVALYLKEAETGGGPFVEAVMNDVKRIMDSEPPVEPQKEIPPAEPTGGKESYSEPQLSPEAKRAYDRYASDPDFNGDPEFLKGIKASLAGAR